MAAENAINPQAAGPEQVTATHCWSGSIAKLQQLHEAVSIGAEQTSTKIISHHQVNTPDHCMLRVRVLINVFTGEPSGTRLKLTVLFGLLITANVASWIWALIAFRCNRCCSEQH
ncbi:MAG TPA: hypothetical protein VKY22_07090 [Bradyrhizobium sp.]|nr:hypothetical protein [Bradyrhizobium sp.]